MYNSDLFVVVARKQRCDTVINQSRRVRVTHTASCPLQARCVVASSSTFLLREPLHRRSGGLRCPCTERRQHSCYWRPSNSGPDVIVVGMPSVPPVGGGGVSVSVLDVPDHPPPTICAVNGGSITSRWEYVKTNTTSITVFRDSTIRVVPTVFPACPGSL